MKNAGTFVHSTMSASLNTVAGTLYEDFVAPFYKKSPKSDASASLIMKLIVLMVGVICVLLVFVVERLGSIMQVRDISLLASTVLKHHTVFLKHKCRRRKKLTLTRCTIVHRVKG